MPHARLLTNLPKAHVERISRRGSEARRSLPADALQQLQEAKDHLWEWRGRPLPVNTSSWTIYADAPHLAWGAALTPSKTSATDSATARTPPTPTPSTGDHPAARSLFVNEKSINGWFQHPPAPHINAKEAHATIKAIEASVLTGQHLDVQTDNTTVYHFIRKWSGKLPHFHKLVRELWDLLQKRQVTIATHWVASE